MILFCGMSIGYEDTKVTYIHTSRAPIGEMVRFVERKKTINNREHSSPQSMNGSGPMTE
jgi:hypothetical protein